MVQSQNTKVDLTLKATSYLSMASYGQVMVGDKAFEFYNDRNVNDYIQIPWLDVDRVLASVLFKGKWIPRFAIKTKENGTYTFSTRENKNVLKAISQYIEPSHMVRSLSFLNVLKSGVMSIFKRKG